MDGMRVRSVVRGRVRRLRRSAGGFAESGSMRFVGVGCLGVVLVFAAIFGMMVWNARSIVANVSRARVVQQLEGAPLPRDQKLRMIERVEALAAGYESGEVTDEQMVRVREALSGSSLIPVGMVLYIEQRYVERSELSAQGKAEARRTLDRFARGIFEGRIRRGRVEALMEPYLVVFGEDQKRWPGALTEDQLAELLGEMESAADAAAVPDEAFEVDVASEFDEVVDEALAEE